MPDKEAWLDGLRRKFHGHSFEWTISNIDADIPKICLTVDGHVIKTNWTREAAESLKEMHGLSIIDQVFDFLEQEMENYLKEAKA